MSACPPWCVEPPGAHPRHRGATRSVPVTVESRGAGGPHPAELLVELSRMRDEVAVWVYLGDGWTGFSLTPGSAARLSAALGSVLRDAGTLDAAGL